MTEIESIAIDNSRELIAIAIVVIMTAIRELRDKTKLLSGDRAGTLVAFALALGGQMVVGLRGTDDVLLVLMDGVYSAVLAIGGWSAARRLVAPPDQRTMARRLSLF